MFKNRINAVVSSVAVGVSTFAGNAMALGPDLTPLTSAVDFGTVTVAVLSIAGMLAVVYVAIKGASIGLGMLRGK
jgi:hypothetical protein